MAPSHILTQLLSETDSVKSPTDGNNKKQKKPMYTVSLSHDEQEEQKLQRTETFFELTLDEEEEQDQNMAKRKSFVQSWKEKFSRGLLAFVDVFGSLLFFVCSFAFYAWFLKWHETRQDIDGFVELSDPLLPYLTSVNFSIPLFILAYGSIVLGLIYGYNKPDLVVEFLQTYACVVWVRMFALYLTPLEVPKDTIPLYDPLGPGGDKTLVRDLFFSGHTATTFTVFFICRYNSSQMLWKLVFLMIGLTTAIMVLVQKTHYAIDVFAAPFFVHSTHCFVYSIRNYMSAAYHDPDPVILPSTVLVESNKKTVDDL